LKALFITAKRSLIPIDHKITLNSVVYHYNKVLTNLYKMHIWRTFSTYIKCLSYVAKKEARDAQNISIVIDEFMGLVNIHNTFLIVNDISIFYS
jgi:hypothetical protein